VIRINSGLRDKFRTLSDSAESKQYVIDYFGSVALTQSIEKVSSLLTSLVIDDSFFEILRREVVFSAALDYAIKQNLGKKVYLLVDQTNNLTNQINDALGSMNNPDLVANFQKARDYSIEINSLLQEMFRAYSLQFS
jgi:hypothetical protein